MDPGMAFGTGTHETTSLCLETVSYTHLDVYKRQVIIFTVFHILFTL